MKNIDCVELLSKTAEEAREKAGVMEGPFAELLKRLESRVPTGVYISPTPERIPRRWSSGRREYVWPSVLEVMREERRREDEQS